MHDPTCLAEDEARLHIRARQSWLEAERSLVRQHGPKMPCSSGAAFTGQGDEPFDGRPDPIRSTRIEALDLKDEREEGDLHSVEASQSVARVSFMLVHLLLQRIGLRKPISSVDSSKSKREAG